MRAKKSFLCMLVLTWFMSGTAWAQSAVPVKVAAKIDSRSLIRAWGGGRVPEIEAYLADKWAKKLGDEYRHWDFHTNPERFYAMLTVRVSEPESRKIYIGMTGMIKAEGVEKTLWGDVWLEPADLDLGRRPPASTADQVLLEKTQALFAEAKRRRIKQWLSGGVPLGSGGHWTPTADPTALRVVTSLGWHRFKPLQDSIFLVQCYRGGTRAEVESEGTRESNVYTNDSGQTYQALVLRPMAVSEQRVGEIPMAEVNQYEVRVIFLKKERIPADLEFF